ncbi:ABC transporter ATP-binding protein [Profundibacterium mesophilum]|uniref:ABC transporter ATP-binding protein n=1 Tax=Profundibacterium mesophilum KAUST100406-0324 TaxID=1037889 RepID=A0A921NNB2_9RHOB|nr:ABC transporter ATP-binding protein [Profundibacterium mesophilum]KAF0674721.1 ABC transporter ATP-binding protein [Profundibacterium mesophilum KAUST100406-0324]
MSALTVTELSYRYGATHALSDVSFSLPEGQFCALLGPNGAGKSTLFALLTRLFVAPRGRIEIAGHDMSRHPRRALARMGVVFQQPTLDLEMTVAGNMRYFAALHGMSGRQAQGRIDAALDRLGMAERANEKARNLNGGHRRRMEIARALIHEPAVLLLDEPTVGLDTAARRAITAHVHGLAAEGLTVFWATHLVDEIASGDEVVILHRGRIMAQDRAAVLADGGDLTEVFMNMTAPLAVPG